MNSYRLPLIISVVALLLVVPLWILPGMMTVNTTAYTPAPQPTSAFRVGLSWDDLRVAPNARTSGTGAPAFEQWYTNGAGSKGVYCYSMTDEAVANNEKEIFFFLQMPHAWQLGTPIHVHVHWVGNSTVTSSAVVWGLEYSWAEPITGLFTNTTIITTTQREGYTAPYTTTQYLHNLSEFVTITPTVNTDNLSTIMMGRLFRNSSNAADTYTDKACLLFLDAHFRVDSLGSVGELTK